MHQLFRPFLLGIGLATGSQGATVAPHEVPAVRHKCEHGGGACVRVFGGATSLGAHWRDEVGVTAVGCACCKYRAPLRWVNQAHEIGLNILCSLSRQVCREQSMGDSFARRKEDGGAGNPSV